MSDREIAAELTREGQAMTHLPECTVPQDYPVGRGSCICDRLRQAEQRGFHRGWRTAEAYWRKVSIRYGRRKVQECRDAVAALPHDVGPCFYRTEVGCTCSRGDALAAIDVLRGKS